MNYKDNIHTGLFSDRALLILNAALELIHGKSQYRKRRLLDVIGKPCRAPNNEIVFKVGGEKSENEFRWCGAQEMSEAQIKKFVAKCMKDFVTWLNRHRYTFTWARDSSENMSTIFNRFTTDAFGIQVWEYYFVYDVMSGRDVRKKYPENAAAELRGVENDQVITSMNECADRETEKLVAEYKTKDDDLVTAFNNEYSALIKKRNEAREANRKNLEEKIRGLVEKFGLRPAMTNALDSFC